MTQLEKIMSIYYGTDKLPYKDEDRQTHYPIAGETNTFVGENNTTKVRFYVDRIGGSNYTWVAKVKKPNGTICHRVLEMNNDDYVDVDLSFLYTDQVGQIDLALNGYTAQDITITEDDGDYEISGNPIVICTGIVKIIINYAPLILNMGSSVQPNEYQQILALLSTKISYGVESEKVNELPTTGKANTIYYVKSNYSDIVYDIYYWNGTTFAYLGTTAYSLYTKEDGIAFENALRSYVNTQLGYLEQEIQQVASGSPKGVYATLSDLQTAYPTGTSGIYVVSANGHWYYWNGSAWTGGGVYQSSVGVVPDTRKIDGVELSSDIEAKDMLNKVQSIPHNVLNRKSEYNVWGSYINQSGVIASLGFDNYFVSHKIYAKKGWVVKFPYDSAISDQNSFCAFDSEDNVVSNVPITASGTSHKIITINNSDVSYIRLTLKGTGKYNAENVNVIINDEWTDTPLEYIGNNYVIDNIPQKGITNDKLDFLSRVPNNIFDKNAQGLEDNKYLDTSGNILSADTYALSDFIEVEEFKTYYLNNNSTGNVAYGGCYYDENKNFLTNAVVTFNVSVNGTLATQYLVPHNAKYVRINIYKTNVPLSVAMFIEGTFSSTYLPYSQIEYNASNKINFVSQEQIDMILLEIKNNILSKYNGLYEAKMISYGDSVCYGTGWLGGYAKLIGDKYDMTYDNYGVSGATITPNMKNSPTNVVGCIRERVNTTTPAYTPNFVLLEGGINDYNLSQQNQDMAQYNTNFNFGTYDMKNYDVSSLDDTTFCGSFEKMLSIALSKYQGAKIIFILIHKWANIYKQGDTEYNTIKDWYNYWVPAIKEMCKKWGVSVVDLNDNCPPLNYITAYRTTYTNSGDGIHPNENGYKLFYVPQIEKEMVRWVEYE